MTNHHGELSFIALVQAQVHMHIKIQLHKTKMNKKQQFINMKRKINIYTKQVKVKNTILRVN